MLLQTQDQSVPVGPVLLTYRQYAGNCPFLLRAPSRLISAPTLLMPKNTTRRPVAIDLFCGAGGMSLGFERGGFDVILAVDYDGHHVATHERNFPHSKSVCASIADLDGKDIRNLAEHKGEIDLVFGGPPCQGFSNMGLRDTGDPRNSLVFHFARLVAQLSPRAFVMENVTGLNSGKSSSLFDAFIEEVGQSYNVTLPVQILNAIDVGVPQARKRLFVIGVRKDVGVSAVYPPKGAAQNTPSVLEALDGLPAVDDDESLFKQDMAQYSNSPETGNKYARRARGLSRYPKDYGHKRRWNRTSVSGCLRTRHSPNSVKLYEATTPGQVVPGHKLPRLDPEGICPTLRAGATSERGTHTAPRPVHPASPRVITAREGARLHGYPDWFSFYPSKVHACRQIGNSVCPPVAHAVALQVMDAIGVNPKTLLRKELVLEDHFDLPANRPPQHRRIPVKQEYPKIINHIWHQAFDEKSATFSFTDFGAVQISNAIRATGAELPRVRPERFLYEAGQQRAIREILSLPLSKGYSIRILDKELGTGRFQKAEDPGSLGLPSSITISSSDLNNSKPIEVDAACLGGRNTIAGLLEQGDLASLISSERWEGVSLSRDMFGVLTDPIAASLVHVDGTKSSAMVLTFETSSVPYTRVISALKRGDKSLALVLLRLTTKHLAAVFLRMRGPTLLEESRVVLSLNDASGPLRTKAVTR